MRWLLFCYDPTLPSEPEALRPPCVRVDFVKDSLGMKYLSKVVWSEGMHLGPHHFQVQNRYFEDSIRFAAAALWFETHGLLGCQMDHDALSNGIVAMIHARGILPDGLSFHFPDCDALPVQRPIADLFPVTRDSVTVLLAVPMLRPNGVNCVLAEDPATTELPASRFTAESAVLWDEVSGRDERSVKLGRKNFRLLLDTEPAEGCVTMPVARAMRDNRPSSRRSSPSAR